MRRTVWASAASAFLAAIWGATAIALGAEPTIRVVCYNVKKGRPAKAIAADLAGLGADIIVLQEVDSGTKRSAGEDQPALLRRALKMHGHYAPSYDVDGGTTGMMILSRFPMSEPAAIKLENSRDIGAAATLSIQDVPVRVLSVHLSATYRISAEHYEESRKAREREATCVMQSIEKQREPVIIAGDLNTTQGSKPYETFASALTDCAARLGPHPAATYPAALPSLRLDHVFVSGQIVPVEAATRKGGSDHLILIVDLRLKD